MLHDELKLLTLWNRSNLDLKSLFNIFIFILPVILQGLLFRSRWSELMPAIWCFEDISSHRLAESSFVLLWTRDRRTILIAASKSAILDPTFQFLVPRIGSDAVDDAHDQLSSVFLDCNHQTVVHHGLSCQKQRIIVHG